MGRAVAFPVERPKREDEPVLALAREARRIGAGRLAVHGPPKSYRGLDADLEEIVEWQLGL